MNHRSVPTNTFHSAHTHIALNPINEVGSVHLVVYEVCDFRTFIFLSFCVVLDRLWSRSWDLTHATTHCNLSFPTSSTCFASAMSSVRMRAMPWGAEAWSWAPTRGLEIELSRTCPMGVHHDLRSCFKHARIVGQSVFCRLCATMGRLTSLSLLFWQHHQTTPWTYSQRFQTSKKFLNLRSACTGIENLMSCFWPRV